MRLAARRPPDRCASSSIIAASNCWGRWTSTTCFCAGCARELSNCSPEIPFWCRLSVPWWPSLAWCAGLRSTNCWPKRSEAHAKRTTLNVKLPVGAGDRPLRDMVGSFWVKDGDRVAVSSILPFSDKTIYLEGHVYRPGSYPYQDGMKITDLVRSYQAVAFRPGRNHVHQLLLASLAG